MMSTKLQKHAQGPGGRIAVALVLLLSIGAAPALGRVYTLASGSAQGIYLPLANDLAAVARKAGLEIRVLPSEGSKQNLAWLADGRADLALTQSDIAWNAYSGKGGFLKPMTSLRVIAPLYTEAVHILILRTLYVHRVEDLRGKRIAIGPAGSGTEANAIQMLGAAGLTLAEVNARHLSLEDAVAALRRGELDAAFVTSGVPSAVVTGVLADRTAALFEPDRDFLERLRGIFPFYLNKNIETSDYPYLHEQVTTAGVQALLVGRGDIPGAMIGRLVDIISSSSKLSVKYRLPTDGEGVSDLEIPLFEEARSHYRFQSLLHQRELLFVIVLALLILSLVFGATYYRRKNRQRPRRDGYQYLRASIGLAIIWIFGSLLLYRAEHRINDNYATPWKSLWSGLITIYSLSSKEPLTVEGRVVGTLMFILGLGFLLWIIEHLASHYVEEKLIPLLRGGFARVQKMQDHYVILGWNEKCLGIIEQLHSEDFDHHRHIVILAPEEASDLPHHRLIHIERGERTSEDNLKHLNIPKAHSVILLANSMEPAEDARTILTILAIRKLCSEQASRPVPVIAEIVDSRNVKLAKYAGEGHEGRVEIVSSNDVGRGLLAQAAVYPGVCTVYRKLLEFKKDNSEIHGAKIPRQLAEQDFGFDDLVQLSLERRHEACVIPLALQRQGEVHVNPKPARFKNFMETDVMFALCDSAKELNDLLKNAVARALGSSSGTTRRDLPLPAVIPPP
jgi:TRAP transporter TAXI family solute receptor